MIRLAALASLALVASGIAIPHSAAAEIVLSGDLSCEQAHPDDILGQIECDANRGYDAAPVEGSCTWPAGQVMVLDRRDELALEAEGRCLGLIVAVSNVGSPRPVCRITGRLSFGEGETVLYEGPLPTGRLMVLEAEDQYDTPEGFTVDCGE